MNRRTLRRRGWEEERKGWDLPRGETGVGRGSGGGCLSLFTPLVEVWSDRGRHRSQVPGDEPKDYLGRLNSLELRQRHHFPTLLLRLSPRVSPASFSSSQPSPSLSASPSPWLPSPFTQSQSLLPTNNAGMQNILKAPHFASHFTNVF